MLSIFFQAFPATFSEILPYFSLPQVLLLPGDRQTSHPPLIVAQGPFLLLFSTALAWAVLCVVLICYILEYSMLLFPSLISQRFLTIFGPLKSPHPYFPIHLLIPFFEKYFVGSVV